LDSQLRNSGSIIIEQRQERHIRHLWPPDSDLAAWFGSLAFLRQHKRKSQDHFFDSVCCWIFWSWRHLKAFGEVVTFTCGQIDAAKIETF
jgi:hypothetical protein